MVGCVANYVFCDVETAIKKGEELLFYGLDLIGGVVSGCKYDAPRSFWTAIRSNALHHLEAKGGSLRYSTIYVRWYFEILARLRTLIW